MGALRTSAFWGSALVVGLSAPLGLAWYSYRYLPPTTVKSGPWNADPSMGTGSANIFVKARTALTILVAVRQREFVYYFTSEDSAGRPLEARCRYRLIGEAPQAAWWSVVLYNRGGFLDPNPARRFSVNASDMATPGVNVSVAAQGTGPNWLPSPRRGTFNLVMRLYTPSPTIISDLRRATLPAIEREGC